MIRVLFAVVAFLSINQAFADDHEHPIFEFLNNFGITGLGNVLDNLGIQLPGSDTQRALAPKKSSNYSFTHWTAFGACSKVCGGGSRARSRACVNATGHEAIIDMCFQTLPLGSYDLYKIIRFGSEMREIDEELCNKHECQVSEWELDESCSQKCGGGFMTYSRICFDSADQQKCNFQGTKLVSCNTQACFRLGEWQEWSRCTAFCGTGQSSRKRSCEPNVPTYSPLYNELMYALEHVTKPAVLRTLTDKNEVFYFSQYLSSCASLTVQTRYCNIKPCPQCPKNQIYHTCKPCTRVCKKVDMTDIFNLKVQIPRIHMNPNGCGGICSAGCGCSPLSPLLGMDGGCYQVDLLCPENHLTPAQRGQLILQLVAGRSRQRTTPAPALQRELEPVTTTTTTAVTTTPSKSKAYCPKDIPILGHDYCICSGILQEVQCVAQPHQKCPVICKDLPACPNQLSPRLKSASECSDPECSSDTECGSGKLCCELWCGRRCIGSE